MNNNQKTVIFRMHIEGFMIEPLLNSSCKSFLLLKAAVSFLQPELRH